MEDDNIAKEETIKPDLSDGFFEMADQLQPKPKQQITVRLDADVLDWFKSQGKGYQSRINAVLKAYVQSQRSQ